MKLGDAVQPPTKLSKALSARPPRRLRKSAAEGSYDEQIKAVAPHVVEASGCENPPSADPSSQEPGTHFCTVIATFPDYALVECMDEDKVWKVPYERDGDDVTCGQPEEMDEVFVPAGDDDEDDESPEV
jgi:hypothetical protein